MISLVFTPVVLHSSLLTFVFRVIIPGGIREEWSRQEHLPSPWTVEDRRSQWSLPPSAHSGTEKCAWWWELVGAGGRVLAPGPLQTLEHLQPQGAGAGVGGPGALGSHHPLWAWA